MSGPVRVTNHKGEAGSIYIDDTAAHTGLDVDTLQALEACVVASLTGNITDFAAGMPIPLGSHVCGKFTAITLTSGKLLAYNRV